MKRNVLFLLVDCLRADSCVEETTGARIPTINSLMQRGTVFQQAIAAASTTSPSVASILTGCYPFVHGIRSLRGCRVNPNLVLLQEAFSQKDYHTVAMVTGPLLESLRLTRGFDQYSWRDKRCTVYSEWWVQLVRQIEQLRSREPWFLFLHLFELHKPRQVLPRFNGSDFGSTKYERALSCLDERIGHLLEHVDIDNTIVVLTGDHGEKTSPSRVLNWFHRIERRLGVRGARTLLASGHGYHVFDYLVRVPLVFVGKDIFPEGKKVADQVRHVDLFPTFMDILGMQPGAWEHMHGRTLMPLIRGESLPEVPAYLEACGKTLTDLGDRLVGMRTPEWKYVFAPHNERVKPQLFHLASDPQESSNAIRDHQDVAADLLRELYDLWEASSSMRVSPESMTPEEEEELDNRLRDLGYL